MDSFEQLNRELRALRETPPEHDAFQQRLAGALQKSALELQGSSTAAQRENVVPLFGKKRVLALAFAAIFVAGGAAATDAVPRLVAYFRATPPSAPTPAPTPQRLENLSPPAPAPRLPRRVRERPQAPQRTPAVVTPEVQTEAQRPVRRERARPEELPRPEAIERPVAPTEMPVRPELPERLRPTLDRPMRESSPSLERGSVPRVAPPTGAPAPPRANPGRRPPPPGSGSGSERAAPPAHAPLPPGGARPERGAPPPPPRPGLGPLPPPRPQ